ncbi:MAG: Uncharacterized protein G01um101429_308 [Parcubacteria group bacterium Gr01-1014_29]|nr:MAG: Uncharacterized protein G01um101429_308 [Parcubacteria group bacterium Gr01-1014_29]
MTLEEFQKFIDEQDAFFRSLGKSASERERVLARTVKLSEELGELCDEVLASQGFQRAGKMETRDQNGLGDEFADVAIVTFLLAKSMNVDIMAALDRKVKKIKEKHNKQLESGSVA